MARSRHGDDHQLDLFSVDRSSQILQVLDGLSWPDSGRFPINRSAAKVRHEVWQDLESSTNPVLVAGYSSIGELVRLVADWSRSQQSGTARVVLGAEPFESKRLSFSDSTAEFSREVESYWLDRGISLRRSAQIVTSLQMIKAGRVQARTVHGTSPMHAKVYVGDSAATTGSSNFTAFGLGSQVEVNARFSADDDKQRYNELRAVADNLWAVGTDWNDELIALLEQLLAVVKWQEALARACADLLEGDWAQDMAERVSTDSEQLWPSQIVGIAQALWIIENVGSVLIADATGSGKTKMGAHLVRSVQDRLWSTGRMRSGLTVLVCPPSVEERWRTEAVTCGLTINTVSHGKLSRSRPTDRRTEHEAVRASQLLVVDEAHNFLNRDSNRTQYLRQNLADHVLLFTATPISRGATDLLELVALLGPDNFEDNTHRVLQRLERRRVDHNLSPEEERALRSEIQRFTLRRTKSQINQIVGRDPEGFVHPRTGQVCRYPTHRAQTYTTDETDNDAAAAEHIRELTTRLLGLRWLPSTIVVPKSLRASMCSDQWLRFRLNSAAGLATHHVLGALRSSRAALFEHLHGTTAASSQFDLPVGFKNTDTGDTIRAVAAGSDGEPPEIDLDCELPQWLTDAERWSEACRTEAEVYESIAESLGRISDAREARKAHLLRELACNHDRVLAFDRHLISLAVFRELLSDAPCEVLTATGQSDSERRKVEKLFAPEARGHAIALCSDAMNEGLNLQGASAITHLDLPTTLRVAEQRVGRVDRMDSPHDEIEAWWPRDGPSFATRANERLAKRAEESETLLGSNLEIPDLADELSGTSADSIVDVEQVQREVEELTAHPSDELFDAIDPVRQLVDGEAAIISDAEYRSYRSVTNRVMARVAPIDSATSWAFFAVRSSTNGAPRWVFVDPENRTTTTTLGEVAEELRARLGSQPSSHPLDDRAQRCLEICLELATVAEVDLLPRRMRRALQQMDEVATKWQHMSQGNGDEATAARWRALSRAARPAVTSGTSPDPVAVAERWLSMITPALEAHRSENPRSRYVLIGDVTGRLIASPLPIEEVEAAFSAIPALAPLEDRISACILGVPATASQPEAG